MTLTPEGVMVSCGLNERLNTVPLPEVPPLLVVPYRVLPDKINSAHGLAPSLFGQPSQEDAAKLCRVVKPVPSVLTANSVPFPELPPYCAVPYRVLPDKTNPACRLYPSLLV